ncbi:MAG: alpha/beta hydrolase [Hyphomicrobiaceae bacterium]|nr:alpha/beta hydrolase [Hyphomicrobiaceae bacterium]
MFPSFIKDVALAYGWVHDHIANKHGLITNKNAPPSQKSRPIFVMGHSAGAHIAALLTLDQRYLHKIDKSITFPAGLIGLAGPMAFDPTTDKTTKEVFASTSDDADLARPIAQLRTGLPPVLLVHGQKDETVGPWNSRQFAKALEKAGAQTCKLEYADIGHVGLVLAISRPLRWRAPVLDACVKFITEVTNGQFTPSQSNC